MRVLNGVGRDPWRPGVVVLPQLPPVAVFSGEERERKEMAAERNSEREKREKGLGFGERCG